ncbi:Non-specific lipid-transfer protein [Bienertia sinuspersici]
MLKKLACLVVVCMVVETLVTPHVAEAAITACNTVSKSLGPCMAYLKSTSGPNNPPGNCCTGVRTLKAAAQTTADRRKACECMKTIAAGAKNLNKNRVDSLPGQCNVRIGYAFNRNIDCNRVQ